MSILSPNLDSLLASTYIGGSNDDDARAITIAPTGNILVAGETDSPNFPTTSDAYQSSLAGTDDDAFLSMLSPDLRFLLYSTYLGGSGDDDRAYAIAANNRGDVYIAGRADSNDFPTTTGAYQTTFGGGNRDGFVARFYFPVPTQTQPEGFKSKKLSDGSIVRIEDGVFTALSEIVPPKGCPLHEGMKQVSPWVTFSANVNPGMNGVWIEVDLPEPLTDPDNMKIFKCNDNTPILVDLIIVDPQTGNPGPTVRFFVEDGNELDADGRVNGAVVDPFAVVVGSTPGQPEQQQPEQPESGQEEEQPNTPPTTTPSAGGNGGGGGCNTGGMSILLSLLVFAVPFLRRLRG